jgi:hypothetical protein
MLTGQSLHVRVFLLFCCPCRGAIRSLLIGFGLAYLRLESSALLTAFVQAGAIAGFLIAGLPTLRLMV